jgi:hypothetical protein
MATISDEYRELLAQLLDSTRKHPIGSRVTDGTDTYTVVAFYIYSSGETAMPLLLSDPDVDDGRLNITGLSELEPLTPAPANPDVTAKARELARSDRESVTRHGNEDILWDNPDSTDQLETVLNFFEADRAWRIAERAQIKAAEERAIRIARVAWGSGNNQSAAGRLLGLDQSRVSRAMTTAHALTGGDTA